MIRHERAGLQKRPLVTEEAMQFNQCRVFLLEARAREFVGVARRKPKRKRVSAAQQCVRDVVVTRDQSLSQDPKPL